MPPKTPKRFKAKLQSIGPGGGWTRMEIPFDTEATFGSRARIAVRGTMNGFAFRTSILPNGDGTHHMMLNKGLLAGAKATAGGSVDVVLGHRSGSRRAWGSTGGSRRDLVSSHGGDDETLGTAG